MTASRGREGGREIICMHEMIDGNLVFVYFLLLDSLLVWIVAGSHNLSDWERKGYCWIE